jgi:alpha-tubulin suppressor-like RCC1 family protein
MGGVATITTTTLITGTHPIAATYSGDTLHNASVSPVRIQAVYARPSIDTGWFHTCGLKADGTLQCWGANNYGQTNVPSPNANWVQVSAGEEHTCGLKADGAIRCWGQDDSGQAPVSSH